MALFDQEEVFDTYVKSERREAAKEAERRTRKETAVKTAVKFLKAGKCSVAEIRDIIPELEDDDITEIEKEFMQQM